MVRKILSTTRATRSTIAEKREATFYACKCIYIYIINYKLSNIDTYVLNNLSIDSIDCNIYISVQYVAYVLKIIYKIYIT